MRIILFIIILLTGITANAQQQDSTWLRDHYTKTEQYIPMRDGVRLYTAIYSPRDTGRPHPILLLRTPYSCAPYGPDNWWPSLWLAYFKHYTHNYYCIVIQDVRGAFKSEGRFVDIRSYIPEKRSNSDIDEASDAYDAIDWLIHNNSGNNGRVGVMGISYPGFYAAMAALSGHPALKAVSPQAPVTDWFMGDDLHHNGAFMLQDAFSFYVQYGFGNPRPQPRTNWPAGIEQPDPDSYHYFLHLGALPHLTRIAGDSNAAWLDLMHHPDLDAWWQERNDRQYVDHIPPGTATLIVGGLFDAEDSYGTWNLYKAIEARAPNNNKLVIGPWYHGQWSGTSPGNQLGDISFGSNTGDWYKQHIEEPFFDGYLTGSGRGDRLPEATVFFTGENRWRNLDRWPPIADTVAFFPGPDHTLGRAISAGADQYTSDPADPVPYIPGAHADRPREYMDADQRFAAMRKDVLVYQTPPLDQPLTVAGPLVADCWISTSTTDADLVIKLIDVFPNGNTPNPGYQMLIRGNVLRGRYRNSFSQPEPFTPGQPTRLRFTLEDIAHTFEKGHCIMIQVQSSWFPLVDRNPQQFVNIYEAKDSDFVPANITLWHNAMYPSRIILPVVRLEGARPKRTPTVSKPNTSNHQQTISQ
jgi:putative CocE/NonD family hydrolase